MVMAVQVSVEGLYLPPELLVFAKEHQTIISLPVHTAVSESLGSGALVVLVAVQLSVLGLYLPPVFKVLNTPGLCCCCPPQMIISLPVHTAV